MKAFFNTPGLYAVHASAVGITLTPATNAGAIKQDGIAVLKIDRPLTYSWDACTINYVDMRKTIESAFLDEEVKAIVLHMATPGGDVSGGFDLAADIRAMRLKYNKPLIAYTDDNCCSMGYAIASACDRIVASPSANLGSIGVIAQLVDCTKADAMQGIKFEVIGSGDRKADRNPHMGFSEGSIKAVEASVDAMADVFFHLVARHRGRTPEYWRSLQAGCYIGQHAKDVGLCDEILTYGEFLSNVGGMLSTAANSLTATAKDNCNTMSDTEDKKEARAKAAKALAEAQAAMAAFDDEDKASAKDEEDEKASAKTEDKDEDKEKASDAPFEKKASASSASSVTESAVIALSKQVEGLLREKAQKERNELLAAYPHVSDVVKASLDGIATSKLKAVLDAMPKGVEVEGNTYVPHLAARVAVGSATPGSPEAGVEASIMDIKFGLAKATHTVEVDPTGIVQTFGVTKYLRDDKVKV
jgi:signal peptide peptidase SppA